MGFITMPVCTEVAIIGAGPTFAGCASAFNKERHLVTRRVFTNTDASPRWPCGTPSQPNRHLGLGMLYRNQTTCLCSDSAPWTGLDAARRIGREGRHQPGQSA